METIQWFDLAKNACTQLNDLPYWESIKPYINTTIPPPPRKWRIEPNRLLATAGMIVNASVIILSLYYGDGYYTAQNQQTPHNNPVEEKCTLIQETIRLIGHAGKVEAEKTNIITTLVETLFKIVKDNNLC